MALSTKVGFLISSTKVTSINPLLTGQQKVSSSQSSFSTHNVVGENGALFFPSN